MTVMLMFTTDAQTVSYVISVIIRDRTFFPRLSLTINSRSILFHYAVYDT